MKKNKLFLLGLFVVFAAVLSLSLVSNTLAKYTTTDNGSDFARVAKWGVTVNVEGSTFADDYAKDDDSFTVAANSVVSVGTDDHVVAPGTKGDMTAIQLTGTPEVAVRVTYVADLELVGWTVLNDTATYLPVIFVINGVEYSAEGTGCDTADDFEAFIEAKVAAYSKDYAAKTDLADANQKAEYLTISWKWAFEGGHDDLDTALGNLSTAPTIDLTVTATVTQID